MYQKCQNQSRKRAKQKHRGVQATHVCLEKSPERKMMAEKVRITGNG